MDNIELITHYLLNTDEDFDGSFEFLTQGLVKEDKVQLREKFKDQLKRSIKAVPHRTKGVITVFGNGEMACELAYVISEDFKGKTLIIDSDRLNPTVDIHLNVSNGKYRIRNNIKGNPESGLGLVIDIINKNMMTYELMDELVMKKSGTKNLKVIHGDHEIDNYEYYNVDGFHKLLDISREKYDYIVIATNDFIYDAYTCHSLMTSDVVLVPCKKELPEINKYNKYIDFLSRKQNMDKAKVRFVAFETNKNSGIGDDLMAEAVCGAYIGHVSECSKRVHKRNIKGSYAMKMSKKNRKEYIDLCKSLGLRR